MAEEYFDNELEIPDRRKSDPVARRGDINWIEQRIAIIEKSIDMIAPMSAKVDKMHEALMGDLEKPGWLSRIRALEKTMKVIVGSFVTLLTAMVMGFGIWIWTTFQIVTVGK
jgi:hypothetical protein